MAYIVQQTVGGNWSAGATWVGGVAPGAGDRARTIGAITVDVDVIIGASLAAILNGTGTISCAGGTQIITGTGTAFTTELHVGDRLFKQGVAGPDGTWVIESITDDTHLTVAPNLAAFAGQTFQYRPCMLLVNNGDCTVAAGKKLTVRGDAVVRNASLIRNAGAQYLFDSSLAAGTPIYWLTLGVFASVGKLVSNGTAGAHTVIDKVVGSGNGAIVGNGWTDWDHLYDDVRNLGSATFDGIYVGGDVGIKNIWRWQHCTFTNVWHIDCYIPPLASTWWMTNCECIDIGAASVDVLQAFFPGGAVTPGLRSFSDNIFEHPLKDMHVLLLGNISQMPLERTIYGRLDTSAITSGILSYKHNLIYVRYSGGVATNWNFVGTGGDTLQDSYVVEDEGPVQISEHELMANDNPGVGGLWKYLNIVFERITANIGAGGGDVVHAGGPTVAGFVLDVQGLVTPPMSNGYGPGMVRMRGNANTTLRVRKSTIMHQPPPSGSMIATGAVVVGHLYAGFVGMLDQLQDCLSWGKAVWAGAQRAGYLGVYSQEAGPAPVADVMNAAGYKNNAHYNATIGTLYDAAGATPTAALGLDGFRQTVKPSLATDVNLGTGANENTQGPKFVDATRNFALFDSVYLGNVAPAWVDAHNYAVGDIVSTSSPEFYGGATINFRCVAAHLSAAANATTGKPGSDLTNKNSLTGDPSGYRQYWELATAERIRAGIRAGTLFTDAALGLANANIIQTLHTWVRYGFQVQAPTLATAASDGGVIGAMPYFSGGGGGGGAGPAHLTWYRQPGGAQLGSLLAPQPIVRRVLDADGVTLSSDASAISVSLVTLSGGPGVLNGTKTGAGPEFAPTDLYVTGADGVYELSANE